MDKLRKELASQADGHLNALKQHVLTMRALFECLLAFILVMKTHYIVKDTLLLTWEAIS